MLVLQKCMSLYSVTSFDWNANKDVLLSLSCFTLSLFDWQWMTDFLSIVCVSLTRQSKLACFIRRRIAQLLSDTCLCQTRDDVFSTHVISSQLFETIHDWFIIITLNQEHQQVLRFDLNVITHYEVSRCSKCSLYILCQVRLQYEQDFEVLIIVFSVVLFLREISVPYDVSLRKLCYIIMLGKYRVMSLSSTRD